ncbi:hypothetical protein [Pseudonocardia parietis]|uniref:Syndecan 1 n=1 Tax=Pseudonocardia parietis TaxID=570936 RepID=A0ABS4VP62_9PSEU|nr:hypothetical protein [Pseudonocardia parietis]MBP2365716.1 hypothetical protein [Pseudonocardia parietis]
MSENPGHKPRHALSETGPSVPAQSGPRDAAAGGDLSGEDLFRPGGAAEVTGWLSVPEQAAAPEETGSARSTVIPQPSSAGDDLSGDNLSGDDLSGGDLFGDAPTQALSAIPRPREDGSARGYPSVAVLARLPEPFRPAPVQGAAAPSSGSAGFRLPELPPTVRPVLPAVLGAATALILALGVVAGVNGAPDPAAAPVPPAPVSNP